MADSDAKASGAGQQEENNKKFRVHVKGYEAVILYPALLTPGLVEKGAGCLTVVLAVKDDFLQARMPNAAPGKKIGEMAARTLHSQLALVPWGDAAIFDTSDVQYVGRKRQVTAQKHMIYSSHMKAVAQYQAENYRGWYLGQLQASNFFFQARDFLVRGFDEAGKPKPLGVIHRAAAAMYLDREYKHLIQLNFKQFDDVNSPGMYELAYVYFKLYDDEADIPSTSASDETEVASGPDGQAMRCCYTDPDDDVLSDYFGEKNNLKQRPELLRTPEKITAFKNTGGDKMFRLYGGGKARSVARPDGSSDSVTIECAALAEHDFLQSRHPVHIPEKWEGKVGAVGDLHVSSRQCLYPLANAQVIPGADPDDSPYVGKIAHQNLSSATQLMQAIAEESDILAIVGDLYDHTRNADPCYFADKIKNTGQLWKAMSYNEQDGDTKQSYKADYDAYPRGIDGLLLLSRILSVYRSGRPVVYVSGNHEGYERPYGISPRVRMTDSVLICRANAGIPADHNLTMYEACLLYGKESYDLGMEGLKLNFQAENFDWLYCLYTPWKDFVLSYGAGTAGYNFISLGWGAKEDFLESAGGGGGTLPRAVEACTQDQVDLAEWAAESTGHNILLSHFTFVCYDQDKALTDSKACIYNTTSPEGINTLTRYDIGSFHKNRKAMYKLLLEKKIHYSICGHSHRAGAYSLGQQEGEKLYPAGRLYSAAENKALLEPVGDHRVLVCGSSGPYGKQNLAGELGGLGQDLPQGLVLNVPENAVQWRKDLGKAKPRLAVVMDYLWYAGDNPPFVREGCPSGIHQSNGAFHFFLSKKFKALFTREQQHPFKQINLIAVGKKGKAMLAMSPEATERNANTLFAFFSLRPGQGGWQAFKEQVETCKPILAHFLSITFTSVPGVVEAEDYDLDSPWCFPVYKVGDYERIVRPGFTEGGEVPDWDWYAKTWESEYDWRKTQ